jgi:hypothetical protein
MSEVDIMGVNISPEPSEAAHVIDRGPQMPPANPMSEVDTMGVNISPEPSEAAHVIDRGPQMPPANPMFKARNFLKLLGLK